MRHTIDTEHPAVISLMADNPRETVEALPVPENGCYVIEFGRVSIGDSVQDVLKASVRDGAHPDRGGGYTELLLINPTSGELQLASINHAETVPGRESREYARVKPVESGHDLLRLEGRDEDDRIRQISRAVIPHGDATSIMGTLDILMALAHRGGVSQGLQRAVRRSYELIRDALAGQEHEDRVADIKRNGPPQEEPVCVGMDALNAAVLTETWGAPHVMDEMSMRRMPRRSWNPEAERASKAFRTLLGDKGLVSVDGGPARHVDEVIASYGDERSMYRQVLVDGMLVTDVPTFAHNLCVINGEDRAVTLRIVAG